MNKLPLIISLALAGGCSQTFDIACEKDDHMVDPDITDVESDQPVVDTDEDTDSEYNGERAVLEGWMSSQGVQYASGNGSESVDMGWWTFSLESFDGLARTAYVRPTGFNFTVEADGDHRFGTPVDQNQVSASEIIDYCWLVEKDPVTGDISTVGLSDIGGPEVNSMVGGPYENRLVSSSNGLEMGLRCAPHNDAPLGTKIAVSMTYEVIKDTDVYDASVARKDNVGVLPGYYVQVGPDSCGNFDLGWDYGIMETVCSRPTFELSTTATIYQHSISSVPISGQFGVRDGMGDGIKISDIAIKIDNLPENILFTDTYMDLYLGGQSFGTHSCISGSDGFGHNEIWCEVDSVNTTLLTTNRSLPFSAWLFDLPVLPNDHEARVTVYYKWTDLTTGAGTDMIVGWPVIDSDSQTISPFTP